MSQLPIENLLQATTLRSDWALSGPGRPEHSDPAFGEHLARVTTPSDPSQKMEPKPTVNPAPSPESRQRWERPTSPRSSDSAGSNPPVEPVENAPTTQTVDAKLATQKSNHNEEKSAEENPIEEQDGNTSNIHEPVNRVSKGVEDADKPENSDDEAKEDETVIVLNVQAIAKTNEVLMETSGEEVAAQDVSSEPEITPLKSQATGETLHTTRKIAVVTEKHLEKSEPISIEATTEILSEDSKVAEPNQSQSDRKRVNRKNEQVAEATNVQKPDSVQVNDEKVLATEIAAVSSVESTIKPDRPIRPNRASAKRDVNDVAKTSVDEVGDPGRQRTRAETIAHSNGAETNQATTAVIVPPVQADARDSTSQKGDKPPNSHIDPLANPLGKLQRGGGRAAGLGGSEESQEKPQINAARFVSRVSKAIQTAQQRGGPLQLRLSPAELGAMQLELSVKDGALTAVLQTETDVARRVLLDHLPALRDRLAEQNIRIERFDVDVRRDDKGGHADGRALQHQQQRQQDQQANNPMPRRAALRSSVNVEPAISVSRPTAFSDGKGLNVVA